MNASSLKYNITIEIGSSGLNSMNSPILSYTKYIDTKSSVYVRSGVTNYNENEEFVFTTEFTIRYNKKTKEINNKYRVLYNNQYYRIIEVIETEPRQSLKLICQHYYAE